MQSVKLQMEVMDSIAPWLLRANIGVVQTGAIGLHVAGFLSASICLPRFWPFHSNLKLCFCVPLVANWCNVPWRHQLGVTCVGGLPWVSQHFFSVSLVVLNGFGEQSSKMQHWLCSLCLSWCSYSIMCACFSFQCLDNPREHQRKERWGGEHVCSGSPSWEIQQHQLANLGRTCLAPCRIESDTSKCTSWMLSAVYYRGKKRKEIHKY